MDLNLDADFPPGLVVLVWVIQFSVLLTFLHKLRLSRSARRSAFKMEPVSLEQRIKAQRQEDLRQAELLDAKVCIQLPLYNEPKHARTLLEHVFRIDYPDELLEVQVLDDSTDETSKIVSETLSLLRTSRPRLRVRQIQRGTRQGYKAGALNYGLALSDSDYFAIFDCDFRPQPAFLKQVMLKFAMAETDVRCLHTEADSDEVACVQAGWTYYNAGESSFTRSQSLLLNTHFYMEHAGRSARNYLFNFNGTAGVWKRRFLEECGGWSDHSVTEDLYLSYQTYLRGRRLLFCPMLYCDSELPQDLGSFLVQQRRWAKGNGQVLRLLGVRLVSFKGWSLAKKVDVAFHLLGYGLTSVVLGALALAPFWISARALWISQTSFLDPFRLFDAVLWMVLAATLAGVYSSREAHFSGAQDLASWAVRLRRALFLLLIAPCLSVLLCRSYWEGVLLQPRGGQLVFKRTPKLQGTGSALCYQDHFIILFLVIYFALLSALLLQAGFYLGAVILCAHSAAIFFLWAVFGARIHLTLKTGRTPETLNQVSRPATGL